MIHAIFANSHSASYRKCNIGTIFQQEEKNEKIIVADSHTWTYFYWGCDGNVCNGISRQIFWIIDLDKKSLWGFG